MDGCVAPSLVEKATSTVEVVEVIFIRLAAEEAKVRDLEVGPEVARRVAVGLVVVFGSAISVDKPFHGVVFMYVFWMRGEEFDRLRPERGDGFG